MTAWSATAYAQNKGVRIAYDRLEGSSGDPLLLVMGLGTSRFWWPAGLCQAFADQGFQVARYDQRDAGESDRMPATATSNPFAALFGKRGEAYTSEDMTDDAVAVMDELGWEKAHVFGHSLGGTIAQRIALRHPQRVLSVVSSAALPSDVSGLGSLRYLRFGLLARLARMRFPEGREGDIEASMAVARGVASKTYPVDEAATRAWIEQQVDSGPRDTDAQSRQIGAQWSGPRLSQLVAPTLVLVGDEDPLVKPSAGRRTADSVPGSRLMVLKGAGHDIPEPLWETVASEVRRNADQANVV